jgi:hypothetical protein
MHCQNCGQVNTQVSNFCRFCGTKFTAMQHSNGSNHYNPVPQPAPINYENAPPRPYSWKTDEYQIPETPKGKPINRVQPLADFQPPPNAAVQPFQPAPAVSHNFNCPRCNSQLFPRIMRQISTAGWITFGVLLITPFFFLFWIGLLIKEDVRVCPVCNFKYR